MTAAADRLEDCFRELDRLALEVRAGRLSADAARAVLPKLGEDLERSAASGLERYLETVLAKAPRAQDLVALSLTPWWAWLVVGPPGEPSLKPLENRTWQTSRRGRFYVHASKGKPEDREQVVNFLVGSGMPELAERLPGEEVQRGGIIGHAYIRTMVRPNADAESYERAFVPLEWRKWHMREQYAYVLEDIHRVPFVECKGKQSFWKIPEGIQAALGIDP